MMGSRGLKGGNEVEALSTKSRRLTALKPSIIRGAKRSFWKRMRKLARNDCRNAASEEAAN